MDEAHTIAAQAQRIDLLEARVAVLEEVISRGAGFARALADLVRREVEQT